VDRLESDPDPFVRACLRENPDAFHRGSFQAFEKATHLERLALVRNPEVDYNLIERIFDPEDLQLGIDMPARGELVCALLSNKEFLDEKARDAGLFPHPEWFADVFTRVRARKFLTTLWELASKWPKETLIPPVVYEYLPGPDEVKAQIYRSCEETRWRQNIAANCSARDTETIKLAMNDPDAMCRYYAYLRVPRIEAEALERILQCEDQFSLSALSRNRSLPVGQLKKIYARLTELDDGDRVYVDTAEEIIEEVRENELKRSLDREVEALFGGEISDAQPDGSITVTHITALGRKLLALEKELVDRLARIEKRLDNL
jgi:hypothetical protein